MPTSRPHLNQLEMRGNFINRHIGPNQQQTKEMLAELGLTELEEIIEQAIPANILNNEPLKLPVPANYKDFYQCISYYDVLNF